MSEASNTSKNSRRWRVPLPTQDRLQQLFLYRPDTGLFFWKVTLGSRARAGDMAGSRSNGYIKIGVDGTQFSAHRLAWVYQYGAMADEGMDIDHIDGDKSNNKIQNLRLVSRAHNSQNRVVAQSSSRVRVLGVSSRKAIRRYSAQIMIGKKNKHLGYFDTVEEAHQAYLSAKCQLHPFFRGAAA
jgi:hypothetical protein